MIYVTSVQYIILFIYVILVKVISGKVYVEGYITYDGNNAITDASKGIVSEGGALHLRSFSQIQLRNGTHVKFVNNTGRYIIYCTCI